MKQQQATQSKRRKLSLRVHRAALLREAEHFTDHKKGIPEWIKNSDDSYTRQEEFDKINFDNLPIIVNLDKGEVCCLDFGGAPSDKMIEHIPFYGSPDAATHGKTLTNKSVSGGHGNGGKYYALSQFKECKIISFYKGKLTVMTIDRDGEYVDVEDEKTNPGEVIKLIGIDEWYYFSKEGKVLLQEIKQGKHNLFCWKGIDPKDNKVLIDKRKAANLVSIISNHPQARSALRTRIVDILMKGHLLWPNLKPDQIEMDESFGVKEFALPNILGNYQFNKKIPSVLKVSLSKKSLSGDKSSLNILEIDANNKNIAYYDIPSILLDKGISKYLTAHIDCPELREYRCVDNDRVHLIEANEASQIFLGWCVSRLQEVLKELTDKEKKIEERKDLDQLSSFFDEVMQEVSSLLEEEDILKKVFDSKGDKESEVLSPSDKPGYGSEGELKKRGGGKREGGEVNKENPSVEKKSKSTIRLLISNHHDDPLNSGNKFDMIERQPILYQRTQDVAHGIWWLNSQKRYIKKIKIGEIGAMPFYFFVIKEIVFSHRARRRYKEQERYDPDGLEELNFDLIDEIFNRIVEKLGIELAIDENVAGKIREAVRDRKKFTVPELSEELGIEMTIIHSFLINPANNIQEHFSIKKEAIKGKKGGPVNVYIRK